MTGVQTCALPICFRREYLAYAARVAGRAFTGAQEVSFAAIREAQLDRLADLISDHLDRDQVLALLTAPHRACPPLRLALG